MNEVQPNGRHARRSLADHAARLLAYGQQHRDGFRQDLALRELDMGTGTFMRTVQYTRDVLESKGETIWCGPAGWHGPWLWKLTNDPELVMAWQIRRLLETARRLRTQNSVAGSAVRMTSPRTRQGKMERAVRKYMSRLIEDIEELRTEAAI